jgi:type IV secretory pathway VirB4 component
MKLTEFYRIYVEKQNAEYTLIYRGNKSKNLTVNYRFFPIEIFIENFTFVREKT